MHCLSQVSTNNVDDNVLEVINFHCLLLTLSPTFCDTIVYNSGKRFLIAYNVCSEVLSQLGENIPETLSSDETTAMTEATLGLVKGIRQGFTWDEGNGFKASHVDEFLQLDVASRLPRKTRYGTVHYLSGGPAYNGKRSL